MDVTREQLAPGVSLTAIHTKKFKSATLSVTLLTPLEEERASVNAIVPHVLRRGAEDYPTMGEITAALDELYGGILDPAVRKKGETQCLGLIGSFLDEPYALEGEPILERAAALLKGLLLHPVTENGIFKEAYISGEKENLILAIRAQMNDKRGYALKRLVREMCREEAYGVDRLGDEAHMSAVTPQSAWAAYRDLLAHAQVELHYCGSAELRRVKEVLAPLVEELIPLRGETVALKCEMRPHPGHGPQRVEERMDVTQGKLCLGFRTGGVGLLSDRFPAMLVFNALYGGTATSKLFLNVREKLSLCYYASCSADSLKGLCAVSSGVEFDRMEEAQGEILAQLDAVRAGNFTDEELESARQAVINAYRSISDSRAQLEQFWLTAALTGTWDRGPEDTVERVRGVTAQEVAQIARGLELDTVYRLLGKEE